MENYTKLFDEIIKSIEQLRATIKGLEEENETLREKLGISPIIPEYRCMSLEEELLENCYMLDENGNITSHNKSLITRAYNALVGKRYVGYGHMKIFDTAPKSLRCLEGKKLKDLMQIRSLGASAVAFIVIACKHYGVNIDNSDEDYKKSKEYAKIEEKVAEMSSKVKFKI